MEITIKKCDLRGVFDSCSIKYENDKQKRDLHGYLLRLGAMKPNNEKWGSGGEAPGKIFLREGGICDEILIFPKLGFRRGGSLVISTDTPP